jgi:uncharacterized membrane protein
MCGAQIADGATTCAACAGRVPVATASAAGMADNVAGMLAYFTIIPAIIFLVVQPYNKSRFVRFHAFQSVFFFVAVFIIHVGLSILTVVPFLIFITAPLHFLVFLGTIIMVIVLAIKANQNLMWKLPVIGDMAEKQANAM